jgi:hypothetical protein
MRNTVPYRPFGGRAVCAGRGFSASSPGCTLACDAMLSIYWQGFRKTGGRFSRKALTPSRDSFVS